jgi:hypothetical protein
MRKFVLISTLVLSVGFAEPKFLGAVKGSVKDYYPLANIKYAFIDGAFVYYGRMYIFKHFDGDFISAHNKALSDGLEILKEDGRKYCKSYKGYMLDNIEFKIVPDKYGYHYQLTANVVCIDF